ncbi:MAG TPA: type IV secretion system DNA-binding domain-containing protein [Bryobacteraceae bacterium]
MRPESDAPRWPRRFPVGGFLGVVLALACGVLFLKLWLHFAPPLERFYFPVYAKGALLGELPALPLPGRARHSGKRFAVVFLGRKVATGALVADRPGPLSIRTLVLSPQKFHSWLRSYVYDGQNLAHVLRWPLAGFGVCLIAFAATGAWFDSKHDREARRGRRLRGPALIGRWRFNRCTRGDGLRFRLDNRRNPLEWLQGEAGRCLRMRRDREAHHIQIAGDTGSGKSTLVREILYQIEQRGEVAIVFDPDREYITEFFDEGRGDWVLNPKDERCPYWPIGAEADDEAEATPVALGLFPDQPTRQQFFLSHTRAIFAYLLATYRPTVKELSWWMAHPEEIDKRVVGTEHAHTLTQNAAPQRAGILGSLNEAGKPLRMMPAQSPTPSNDRRIWTVREWAEKRCGWIFITSTPDTIDALRPLQSLWLDMLILKLQASTRRPGQARVWMVLDELASLNALPQLHSALTKQRKSDNPIVLGFQGMSQLDALYGKRAETILSQAFTNIVLRTREARAAKHLSELMGKAQLERIRESHPAQLFERHHRSYSTERVIDPVVMESEIQTLDDLHGYFVQQDKIVAIRFHPRPKRRRAKDLVERIIPPVETRLVAPEITEDPKPPAPPRAAQPARKKAAPQTVQTEMGMDIFG